MHLTSGLYIILFSLSALTAAPHPRLPLFFLPETPALPRSRPTLPRTCKTSTKTRKEKDFPRQSFFIIRPIPVLAANKP